MDSDPFKAPFEAAPSNPAAPPQPGSLWTTPAQPGDGVSLIDPTVTATDIRAAMAEATRTGKSVTLRDAKGVARLSLSVLCDDEAAPQPGDEGDPPRYTPGRVEAFRKTQGLPVAETPPAEGDPLAEMRAYDKERQFYAHDSLTTRGKALASAEMLAIAERTVLPALVAAQRDAKVNLAEVKRLRTIVHADYQIKSEQEKRIFERQSTSEAEVAKLRTRCRNQRRELRDQERRRERAVASCMRVFAQCCADNGTLTERARAAEAEVVRLTEACDAANASNQRRLADMKEAAADRAALTELVAADGTADAQRLARAWAVVRERVKSNA